MASVSFVENASATRARLAYEAGQGAGSASRIKRKLVLLAILGFYVVCWQLAQVDLARLWTGLPKLGSWLVQAWPPKLAEVPLFLQRIAETLAMAAIGTTAATLMAIPMAVLASRNITPFPRLYLPARWFLNALRGIDSFVFALLFVAAVGLGPFAGVIGIALHTWGSAAKFSPIILKAPQWGRLMRLRPPALVVTPHCCTPCCPMFCRFYCPPLYFGGSSMFALLLCLA